MLSFVLSFLSTDSDWDREGQPEKKILEVKNITKAERKSFKYFTKIM